jgi:hypothetical protein
MDVNEFFKLSEEERDHIVALHQHRRYIQETRDDLISARKKLEYRELNLQNECQHIAVVKTHKANTGNYSPSDDCYWTEFSCPDCGKRWQQEGSV